MRIAIDASSVPEQPAGAGIYAMELARAIAELGRSEHGYALFARGSWAANVAAGRKNWRAEPAPRGRAARLAWEQSVLPRALSRLQIDVLHSTHHTLPLRSNGVCRVVTVHDVTFMRLPERYTRGRRLYMRSLTQLAVRRADAVIVPSQTVREDVQRLLGVPGARLHVVHEAAAPDFAPMDAEAASAVARRYSVEQPFLLSVGSREPGKNRGRLLHALHSLRAEGIAWPLLIAGQPAWHYDAEAKLVDELGLRGSVRFAGYVPRADLPALYSAAGAFVFPSLYEGFGLPVLEAMACGTPVLTSNVSATAEIAADAAVLVDPRSIISIRDGLRRIMSDGMLRAGLARAGRERAARFSWRQAAIETHSVYAQALEESRGR